MDKKTLAVISVVAVTAVGLSVYLATHKKPSETSPPVSQDTVSDVPASSSSAVDAEQSGFHEIEFDDAETMLGRAEYMTLEPYRSEQKEYLDSLSLVKAYSDNGPMIYATGHQVYHSNTDEMRYILSGYSPIKLYEGRISNPTFIREEGTGERIYAFPNKTEEEAFQNKWDSGQRILSGKTLGEKGRIIVDGRLIDGTWTEKNGEILFNLYDVAHEVDTSCHYAEEKGYISVCPNEFVSIQIPTTAANYQLQKSFHVIGGKFTFTGWAGDRFTLELPVLDYENLQISARDCSRMFGWRMYTNGAVLSIVSDPLNVTNKTVIYTSGSMGLTTRVERNESGEYYANTYDSNGLLISSEPIDPNVSDVEGEMPSESLDEPLDSLDTPSESLDTPYD